MTHLTAIVPTHNAAPYIKDLMSCLSAQSNISVIFVDDRSTDGTVALLHREAQAANLDVKILKSDGNGPGAASNVGIREATTEYIFFLDSDDVLSPDFSELITAEFSKAPDIIETLFKQVDFQGNVLSKGRLDGYLRDEDRVKSLAEGRISMVAWGKAYKLDFLKNNNILFPRNFDNGEDHLFTLRAYSLAEKIILIPRYLYEWRRRPGSLTKRPVDRKRVDDCIDVARTRIRVFKGPENVKLRQALYVRSFKEWVDLRSALSKQSGVWSRLKGRLLIEYGRRRFLKQFPIEQGQAQFVKKKDPRLFEAAIKR